MKIKKNTIGQNNKYIRYIELLLYKLLRYLNKVYKSDELLILY